MMRFLRLAALCSLALVVACAPKPTHSAAPPTPDSGPRVPPAVSRGLPEYVEIELSHAAPVLVYQSMDGRKATMSSPGRATGPVRVEGRLHDGELIAERDGEDLRAIARLPLETYVAGVVAAELSLWSAEPAELEAQAIAARTFAIATLLRSGRSRLSDGVLDQAYHGSYETTASAGSRRARARLDAAIDATRGLVLMRGRGLEEARYHAACGGATADFSEVFAREVRTFGAVGPASTVCPGCTERARVEAERDAFDPVRPLGWVAELGPAELESIGRAAQLGGPPRRIAPHRRDRRGRWLEAELQGAGRARVVPFDDVRRAAGYRVLPSAVVGAMRPEDANHRVHEILVQGRGRGHGVGLCQEGTRDLARRGWSSERILGHYYRGTRIVTVDEAMRAMGSRSRP